MQDEAKLKNCPKCGGKAEISFVVQLPKGNKAAEGAYCVRCRRCNFSYPVICSKKDEAIKMWNTGRAPIKAWIKRKFGYHTKSSFWKKRQKAFHRRGISRKIKRIFTR